MFEKEAEERLPQAKIDYCNSFQFKPDEVSAIEMVRFGSGYTKGFKDGAEFGYNKANEWHKADVPTTPINKVVLGYIKDYNTKKFCLVKWNGEWWYDARTWNDKVKLIAWKEIVLPELPKESE